jgi:aspartate-semialdehyde dehydrogenase
MKKLFAAIAVASLCLLAACAGVQPQTPAQIAAAVCPVLQPQLAQLQASGVFTGGAAATLDDKIAPDLNKVCVAGALVTSTSLAAVANEAVPLIVDAINASSMSAANKNTAVAIVSDAQLAITSAIALYNATQPAAPAATPTAPASAASAALVA